MLAEPEMDALLSRLAPGLDQKCEGASEEEIGELEAMAGEELPGFYRWFLKKLGRDAGPLPDFFEAYSVRTVLTAYADGDVPREPQTLLIARMEDPVMRQELYYDLGQRTREDALVVRGAAGDGEAGAETLREWLAYLTLFARRVRPMPQRCAGILGSSAGNVVDKLTPVMIELGFSSPIATGPYCALHEREDMVLVAKNDPEPENLESLVFRLGGTDAATLRRLLGHLATAGDLEIRAVDWEPNLRNADSK